MDYIIATDRDIDNLTTSRIEVLRAANLLDENADMTEVEVETRNYYKKALVDGSHVAILVKDGDNIIGAGGISYYEVMPTYHNLSGKKAYLMNMYTKPEYRRQGIVYVYYITLDLIMSSRLFYRGMRKCHNHGAV